jgi:hypothetical protein
MGTPTSVILISVCNEMGYTNTFAQGYLRGLKSLVLWGLPLQRKVVIRREFILFGCNSCGQRSVSRFWDRLGGVTNSRARCTSFDWLRCRVKGATKIYSTIAVNMYLILGSGSV